MSVVLSRAVGGIFESICVRESSPLRIPGPAKAIPSRMEAEQWQSLRLAGWFFISKCLRIASYCGFTIHGSRPLFVPIAKYDRFGNTDAFTTDDEI